MGDEDVRASLRDATRTVLSNEAGTPVVRAIGADPVGRDHPLWRTIVALGCTGVEVPEEHGGLGASFADVCVVLHEMGRLVTPGPFTAAAVLGTGALLSAGPSLQGRWLPAVASGDALLTAALTGPTGVPGSISVEATPQGGGWVLDGEAGFVPDLGVADAVAVAVRHAPDGGASLFLVPADTPGLAATWQPTVDRTRRLYRMTLDEVPVRLDDAIGPVGRAEQVVTRLLDRGAVALAADSVGGAERVLEMTVAHLQERHQFGRAVGSFQALKHRCASMFLKLEMARAAVEHAAQVSPDDPQWTAAVSMAKSYAGDACSWVAEQGVQLHGGIGFTWEHDMHLYLKRQKLDEALFGTVAWHRGRVATVALSEGR